MAEKFSRVHAYVKVAKRLQEAIADAPVGTPEFYELSREFRAYGTLLNKEMEPVMIDVNTPEQDSPFAHFNEMLKNSGFDMTDTDEVTKFLLDNEIGTTH